jgi:hypothetical protein
MLEAKKRLATINRETECDQLKRNASIWIMKLIGWFKSCMG